MIPLSDNRVKPFSNMNNIRKFKFVSIYLLTGKMLLVTGVRKIKFATEEIVFMFPVIPVVFVVYSCAV